MAMEHPVQVAVLVREVSEAGFYACRNRGPSARSVRLVLLTETIRRIHAAPAARTGPSRSTPHSRQAAACVFGTGL